MEKRTLEIVSSKQARDYEVFGGGEDSWIAVGDMKGSLAVRVEGSDKIFLVRVPVELLAELGFLEASPAGPREPRRYGSFDALVEDVLAIRAGGRVLSCDDPSARTIGFSVRHVGGAEEVLYMPLTAVKSVEDPLLQKNLASSTGRAGIAECLSHGHGPKEWRGCPRCSTVLSIPPSSG